MEKKAFKAESQRLLDLMIHSIYTHKEIFLREIISNASDAIDKLCYLSLTDENVGLKREDFAITLSIDKENRTLTVSDNGIGMDADELENNLGVIASSGTFQFRQELDKEAEADVIGQFGVGFYSAFMVADEITVRTKKYGSEQAYEGSPPARTAIRSLNATRRPSAPTSSCTSSPTRTRKTTASISSPTACTRSLRSIPTTFAIPFA